MRTEGKRDAFICGIIIFIGIMISLTDFISEDDLAWTTYAFLTGGCAASFQLVRIYEDKRKKIFSAVALVGCQSLNTAAFLTGLTSLKIAVIVCLVVAEAVFALFFIGVPSKRGCTQAELRRFADSNGILKYNLLSNAVCVLGSTALAYNSAEGFVPHILILLLMLSVTLARQFYSKKYFTKKPIAYVSELVYIAVGFSAVTFVAWIREIPQSGLGFAFIYIVFLTSVYVIFDRPYVVEIVEKEIGNRNIK